MTRRAQIFFFLYVGVIAYLCLFPGDFTLHPHANRLLWYPITGRRQILDATLNVLFYLPLGAAGVWSFRRKAIGWPVAVGAGVALSALIEWLQLWAPTRFGTLNDLVANSLGVALGATFAVLVDLRSLPTTPVAGPSGVLLILWFLWHAFPFVPRISLLELKQIGSPMPWSWVSFAQALLGACALGAAVEKRSIQLIAFAVLPAQILLLNHTLSYATMAGAALGLAAAARLNNRAIGVLGWGLPVWLAVDEFRPFAFREPAAFAWPPFSTWYDSSSSQLYTTLFGKFFLYTATVWCLEKRGLRWWQAAGIPAVILTVGEVAQMWIVGRTPESTDIVLVAAGAILLKLAGTQQLELDQLATKSEEGQVKSL